MDHSRRSIRLTNYNYSRDGFYFVTLCTQNRQPLFGQIVGAIHESPSIPSVELSDYGIFVRGILTQLPQRYDGVAIDVFCIMPNHIHMILSIASTVSPPKQSMHRSLLSQIIGFIKMNTTKQMRIIDPTLQVWQRNYYEHIIRDEEDYYKIQDYILSNPAKWEVDPYF